MLQRDRHVGEVEEVPARADALDGVLGGVVEQAGDLAIVLGHHADRTERGRTRATVAATQVSHSAAVVRGRRRRRPCRTPTGRCAAACCGQAGRGPAESEAAEAADPAGAGRRARASRCTAADLSRSSAPPAGSSRADGRASHSNAWSQTRLLRQVPANAEAEQVPQAHDPNQRRPRNDGKMTEPAAEHDLGRPLRVDMRPHGLRVACHPPGHG